MHINDDLGWVGKLEGGVIIVIIVGGIPKGQFVRVSPEGVTFLAYSRGYFAPSSPSVLGYNNAHQ